MEVTKPEAILQNLLKDIYSENKDIIVELDVKELNTGGANYSSVVYNVIVISDKGERKLFAKVATWPESIRQKLNFEPAFEIERYFYVEIIPRYNALQEKYIPLDNRIIFPEYYGSNPKVMEESIVLEDLISEGYKLHNRFEPVDWEYASKAVETIAKFHALSFAFKNEYPEIYEKDKPFFDWKRSFFINLREPYMNTAESIYDIIPEDLKKRFQDFIEHSLSDEMFEKYYGFGKWGVLLHGDFRSSNIMYKITSDGKASLIPVDYQNLHHGSPSTDLFYLIYTATDEHFRRLHLEDLLNHYYSKLSEFLQLMNLDPKSVFSKEDFEEDYENNKAYGLVIASTLLPVVLVEIEDTPTMDKEDSELTEVKFKLGTKFKARFLPILDEFVKQGVL